MPVLVALVLALVVALAPAGPASAQQNPPRIGLVLSGGAARGAAHVGVLRVLEELRIPIHAIAGTSMGAVVGGLYASGLTADELERELTGTDWTAVFRDDVARGAVSFRRKQEQRSMLLDPELGIGLGGIRLPPGLVEGHRLGLLLDTLLLPVLDRRDFSRLPIPFRATATDIETGELVVLEGGDLSEAIRASMAFPAAFSPVMVDGRLLVDGGIVRNLPLDLVRNMGVDVVIAVDVGSDLDPRESLRSLLGIALQTVTLVTRHNTAASIEADPPDLLIRPVIGDIPFTSFPRSRELIERGDSAARDAGSALRNWSLPADAYADWRRRVRESRGPLPVIDRIRVEHDDPERARRLRRELRIEPGRRIDAGILAADLDRLYGRGLYDRVGFTIEREDGGTTLVVRPVPESPGPELRFGLALGDDFSGRGGFALQAQLLVQRVTPQGGEVRLVARAGDDRHVGAELYQPIGGASPAFLAAGLGHRRRFVEGPLPGVPSGYEEQRTRSGLRAGLHVGTWAEATAGVELDQVEAGPTGEVSEAPVFDGREAALVMRVEVDLLDDAEFPGRGLLSFGEIRVVPAGWADVPAHSRLEGGVSLAFGRGPHSLVLTAGGAGPLDGPLPFHDRFRLGGPLERSALAPLDALGEKLAVGRVLYLYRFGPGGIARAGLALELGEAWTGPAPSFPGGLRAGATGLVAIRTVLGPAFVSLGVGEGGHWLGRLVLGRLTF